MFYGIAQLIHSVKIPLPVFAALGVRHVAPRRMEKTEKPLLRHVLEAMLDKSREIRLVTAIGATGNLIEPCIVQFLERT